MSAPSAEIRARLDHPVVDCDGHMIEHMPVFLDFLKQVAGPDLAARYTEIWEARKALYREAAHLSVNMDGKTRELVAEEVWRLWRAS